MTRTDPKGTVIVVGASSGIGAALAKALAHEARPVAVLARRGDALQQLVAEIREECGAERAFAYEHDAADPAAAEPLFARIESAHGPVDELHFVAGIMPPVELDEFSTDKDAAMFQVNTVGSVAWCNAAARRFLERKAGTIVGVTSVAGDRGRHGRPGYCASKAGQDAHLESLRNRLWRHGVQVTTIRPGFVETPMTEGLPIRGAISAARAARLILRARDRRRAIAYVPLKWWPIMTVVKLIPSFLFRRLNL